MTYTGPFPFDNTGTIDGILVASSFSGIITNDGTITTSGISVVGSTITGRIRSNGTLAGGINVDRGSAVNGDAQAALFVPQGSFAGGIHNGGSVSGAAGIEVDIGASFSGVITNTGTISNTLYGIQAANVSVFDSGSIAGSSYAIFFTGGHNTLTLAAGYSITGTVLGIGSALQLGGSGSATFDPSKIGAGKQYQGFSTFNVVGGTWTLTAASSQSWTIKAGTLELGAGSSITSQTTTFAGSGATLQIDTAMSQIASTLIKGAGIGDALDLRFQAYSAGMHAIWTQQTATFGPLNLLSGNGTTFATFFLTGVYSTAQFQVASDNNGGTLIEITAPLLPTLSVQNSFQAQGQARSLSQLNVVISDRNGAGYKQLQLWDSAGGGSFVVGGTPQSAGHEIDVPAGTSVTYTTGSVGSTNTLWARLLQNDGSLTPWQQFTVTIAQPNLITANSTIALNQTPLLGGSGLLTVSDPSGVGYQQLQLWDSNGTGTGGQFFVGGTPQTGGHEIDLTPTQAASASFVSGNSAGTDTVWARLKLDDNSLTPWQQFVLTMPQPTLTATSVAAASPSATIPLFPNLLGVTNLAGAVVQAVELYDSNGTVAGGRFIVNGAPQTGGHTIDLTDAQAAHTNFVAGTAAGTDTLWARLLMADASVTPWQQFTITVPNPTLTTAGSFIEPKSTFLSVLNTLVTINDPANVGYQQLQLWDGGGNGTLFVSGAPQVTGAEIDVARAFAGTVGFQTGSGVGTDTLWARLKLNDNSLTAWQRFTITVPQPTLSLHTVIAPKNFSTTALVAINDPGFVGYQKLELWDSVGGAGGHFVVLGQVQPEGQQIDVLPGTSPDISHS